MSLSEDEKSRLDEIAAHVLATDPDFVLRLRAAARHPSAHPSAYLGPRAIPTPAGHPSHRTAPAADRERNLSRQLIMLSCLLFVGVSLVSNGLTAAQGLISLGSVVAFAGVALTGWTTVALIRLRRAFRSRPA